MTVLGKLKNKYVAGLVALGLAGGVGYGLAPQLQKDVYLPQTASARAEGHIKTYDSPLGFQKTEFTCEDKTYAKDMDERHQETKRYGSSSFDDKFDFKKTMIPFSNQCEIMFFNAYGKNKDGQKVINYSGRGSPRVEYDSKIEPGVFATLYNRFKPSNKELNKGFD